MKITCKTIIDLDAKLDAIDEHSCRGCVGKNKRTKNRPYCGDCDAEKARKEIRLKIAGIMAIHRMEDVSDKLENLTFKDLIPEVVYEYENTDGRTYNFKYARVSKLNNTTAVVELVSYDNDGESANEKERDIITLTEKALEYSEFWSNKTDSLNDMAIESLIAFAVDIHPDLCLNTPIIPDEVASIEMIRED